MKLETIENVKQLNEGDKIIYLWDYHEGNIIINTIDEIKHDDTVVYLGDMGCPEYINETDILEYFKVLEA